MTDLAPLAIERFIVHRIHQKPAAPGDPIPKPVLADLPSPLNPEVVAFLGGHVARSRADHYLRRGKFKDHPAADGAAPNLVGAACDEIFAHPGNEAIFVAQSHVLAERLIAAEKGKEGVDARIAVGDLIVCLFSLLGSAGAPTPVLAILKIDPQDGFARETRGAAGKTRVVLSRVADILTESRLQKCALIYPGAERALLGHDLAVLDLLSDHRNATTWSTSYFVERYLRCEVNLNVAELLVAFTYRSGEWIDRHTAWPDAQKEWAKEQVIRAAADAVVDVRAFAERIVEDTAERERYVTYLQEHGMRDLVFEPDPTRQRRLAEFLIYEGDRDLTVRVRAGDYGDAQHLVAVAPQRDGQGRQVITITTQKWALRLGRSSR